MQAQLQCTVRDSLVFVVFQVLSNPSLRQQYDKHGAEGLHTDDLMDSAAFFACLFGSEMFDHLIGELALATIAR